MKPPLPLVSATLLMSMIVIASGLFGATEPNKAKPSHELSLSELEVRLTEIDQELGSLARYSLRSGLGPIGYRSAYHTDANAEEWVEIHFGAEYRIDSLALVPNIWRDSVKGFQSDGFPIQFRVIAGKATDQTGRVIAECEMDESDLPRIAPLIINVEETRASWIRIEVIQLARRAFDRKYIFQLAELMVFSGNDNVVLNRPVLLPEHQETSGHGWDTTFLVDGATPYLLDSATGEPSIAYLSLKYSLLNPEETNPALSVDLGESYLIDHIHLHAVDQSDTIPQAFSGNYGIPERLHIVGANKADFSDAVTLLKHTEQNVDDLKPILMLSFPPKNCRYLKFIAEESEEGWANKRMGFAEIECFANGRNVALSKPFTDNFKPREEKSVNRKLSALTDGRNLYGEILPVRIWMEELARRHELERERPVVEAALQLQYTHQKVWLRLVTWLAVTLAVGIIITVLIDRIIRMRQVAHIKERFAADLHDELGANVQTIGLLSDAARESHGNEADWQMLHKRIRDLSERTGTAIRHCTNMLEAKGLYFGLAEDIRRVARRNMANYEHSIKIAGEEFLAELKPRIRVDLFLFYKECLVNISRHSGATRFATELIANEDGLLLTISDNGKGLQLTNRKIPGSLKRRARLLKANIQVETILNEGTRIVLTLKHPSLKWWGK